MVKTQSFSKVIKKEKEKGERRKGYHRDIVNSKKKKEKNKERCIH